MASHEQKTCPRCQTAFECKPGTITECQCFGIKLSVEERAFLDARYEDCLCRKCLEELKDRYVLFREKYLFR